MEYEKRPMPKSTIIAISILVGITVLYVIYNTFMQSSKIEKVLKANGHEYIENVSVYANHGVKNEETKEKGQQLTVSFDDLKTKQHCKGFIIIMNKSDKVIKDLDCK